MDGSLGGFLEYGYAKMVGEWKIPLQMDENWGYPYFMKPPIP